MKTRLRLFALFNLLFFLSACANLKQPDLQRLYRQSWSNAQPPVILVPGILGSKLRDKNTGEEVWYGNAFRLIFSDYETTALEFNPATLKPEENRLEAFHITDKIAGQDFYGSIIDTLRDAGGYQPGIPGTHQITGSRNYYIFNYDWRQDNTLSARQLSRLIDQIRIDYNDPELKVDIIAHSMGGLITRYFLRYGELDTLNDNDFPVNLEGSAKTRRVILLGTPNLGSVSSLQAFIKGFKVALGALPPEALATFPSVYQLFPHALTQWLVTIDGEYLQRDIFDIEIWRRFQWSIFDPEIRKKIREKFADQREADLYMQQFEAYFEYNLERARRFVWSLTVPMPQPHHELIVMGGDCQLTPARLLVEEDQGISQIRLWPREIKHPLENIDYDQIMLEPGDGTVTKSSLLARDTLDPSVPRNKYSYFPLAYSIFLCEDHDKLTTNAGFRDNLLQALLSAD